MALNLFQMYQVSLLISGVINLLTWILILILRMIAGNNKQIKPNMAIKVLNMIMQITVIYNLTGLLVFSSIGIYKMIQNM